MNSQGDRATIRLLLADDQALVRGALAALLDLESDLSVVAEVGRGDLHRRWREGAAASCRAVRLGKDANNLVTRR